MPAEPLVRERYGWAVAIAMLGLVPNTVLTTAFPLLTPALQTTLSTGQQSLQVVEGLSNAALAGSAVLAAYLAQRRVQRRTYIGYQALFLAASVLAVAAPDVWVFGAGRVVQGLATGLMVINAIPLLVNRFGQRLLPVSVALVNVGLFGSTTLGPIVGGELAGAPRVLLAGVAVLALGGLVVAYLAYPRFEPLQPQLRADPAAIAAAFAGSALLFFATGWLSGAPITSPAVVGPAALGLVVLVAVVVAQYRSADPLMPVRALSTQLPVTGIVVAMVGGAVFVAVVGVVQRYLAAVAHAAPSELAVDFWPMPVGLLVAALLFGALFRTRWLALLVDGGLLALLGGIILLLTLPAHGPPAQVAATVGWSSALLGFGAGATVSPGLFLAAMGVPSTLLGRAFALVLLLRAVAAYAVAPVVLYVVGAAPSVGIGAHRALVAMAVLAGVGLLVALAVPALSGARLRRPDLDAWMEEGRQALPSPVTAVHARPGRSDEAAEDLLPRPVRSRRG